MYPVKSKGVIDVMSVNLLLENDTDPVLWRGPILGNVVKQFYTDVIWKDIDYLFVDMPPGTGDVAITVYQSLKLDGIITVSYTHLCLGSLETALKHLDEVNGIGEITVVAGQNTSLYESLVVLSESMKKKTLSLIHILLSVTLKGKILHLLIVIHG